MSRTTTAIASHRIDLWPSTLYLSLPLILPLLAGLLRCCA